MSPLFVAQEGPRNSLVKKMLEKPHIYKEEVFVSMQEDSENLVTSGNFH